MKGNDIKLGVPHLFTWKGKEMTGIPTTREKGEVLMEVTPTISLWVINRSVLKKIRKA